MGALERIGTSIETAAAVPARPLALALAPPRALLGLLADVHSIAESTRALTGALDQLVSINRRVDALDAEVRGMRAAVERIGANVGPMREAVEPLEAEMAGLRSAVEPLRGAAERIARIGRIGARVPRRRPRP